GPDDVSLEAVDKKAEKVQLDAFLQEEDHLKLKRALDLTLGTFYGGKLPTEGRVEFYHKLGKLLEGFNKEFYHLPEASTLKKFVAKMEVEFEEEEDEEEEEEISATTSLSKDDQGKEREKEAEMDEDTSSQRATTGSSKGNQDGKGENEVEMDEETQKDEEAPVSPATSSSSKDNQDGEGEGGKEAEKDEETPATTSSSKDNQDGKGENEVEMDEDAPTSITASELRQRTTTFQDSLKEMTLSTSDAQARMAKDASRAEKEWGQSLGQGEDEEEEIFEEELELGKSSPGRQRLRSQNSVASSSAQSVQKAVKNTVIMDDRAQKIKDLKFKRLTASRKTDGSSKRMHAGSEDEAGGTAPQNKKGKGKASDSEKSTDRKHK
ncbi:hypothetical protein P7C70_g8822, partial [Phenoliferia sp. Uapishka_3]